MDRRGGAKDEVRRESPMIRPVNLRGYPFNFAPFIFLSICPTYCVNNHNYLGQSRYRAIGFFLQVSANCGDMVIVALNLLSFMATTGKRKREDGKSIVQSADTLRALLSSSVTNHVSAERAPNRA